MTKPNFLKQIFEKRKIKPFPYLFCQGCMLNGCYPWNDNPLLLCGRVGGISLGIMITERDGTPRQCVDFTAVTTEIWLTHLSDLKMEAKRKETLHAKTKTIQV